MSRPLPDPAVDVPTAAAGLAGATQIQPGRRASLGRNSAARFVADSAGLVFGMVASVITARWLGPSGKGLFSSLTFLGGLVMQACSIGLGDAAIVLVGQRRATLQQALSATVAAALASSVVGMGVFWLVGMAAFHNDWAKVRGAMLIASLGLPIALCAYLLAFILNAQERIVASSVVLGLTSAASALGLYLFVVALPLGVSGGVLSVAFGAAAGLALAAWLVTRARLSLRPHWDWSYLRDALRYGVSVEASYLVTVMFLRVDLLFVYALAGSGPAGQYSVGLTVGALVALLPIAISNATFPRLANLGEEEAKELTAQACRFGVAAAVFAGAVLVAMVPIAIPLLFGHAFRGAVSPTLILVPGGVMWSCQWLLCRAWAARGRPGMLVITFSLSLVIMSGLDFLLIPRLGINGAAISALIAPAAGLVFCLRSYRRSPSWDLPLRRFLPRPEDFRALVTQSLQLLPFPRSGRPVR